MIDVRVRFSKHGAIRYIGHLDVMRYMQKVVRRAEFDIAFSNGFSPHPLITFAQPLGVGIESDGEYMDLRMNSITDCQDLLNRINAASVPEIQALSVKVLPEKTGNAMASVAAAEYYIGFKDGRCPKVLNTDDDSICKMIIDYLSQEQIIIQKEGKAGIRDVDIKPGIFMLEWDVSEKCFHCIVDASSGYNIKPSALITSFLSHLHDAYSDNSLLIYRQDMYTRDKNGQLISMDLIGTIQ